MLLICFRSEFLRKIQTLNFRWLRDFFHDFTTVSLRCSSFISWKINLTRYIWIRFQTFFVISIFSGLFCSFFRLCYILQCDLHRAECDWGWPFLFDSFYSRDYLTNVRLWFLGIFLTAQILELVWFFNNLVDAHCNYCYRYLTCLTPTMAGGVCEGKWP